MPVYLLNFKMFCELGKSKKKSENKGNYSRSFLKKSKFLTRCESFENFPNMKRKQI